MDYRNDLGDEGDPTVRRKTTKIPTRHSPDFAMNPMVQAPLGRRNDMRLLNCTSAGRSPLDERESGNDSIASYWNRSNAIEVRAASQVGGQISADDIWSSALSSRMRARIGATRPLNAYGRAFGGHLQVKRFARQISRSRPTDVLRGLLVAKKGRVDEQGRG
jgi:hypothetical protein